MRPLALVARLPRWLLAPASLTAGLLAQQQMLGSQAARQPSKQARKPAPRPTIQPSRIRQRSQAKPGQARPSIIPASMGVPAAARQLFRGRLEAARQTLELVLDGVQEHTCECLGLDAPTNAVDRGRSPSRGCIWQNAGPYSAQCTHAAVPTLQLACLLS